jgi:hypothetical protein
MNDKTMINSFDIDGVLSIDGKKVVLRPMPADVIITGRSFEERVETAAMLRDSRVRNDVMYNPLPFDEKTRETSGLHKASVIKKLGNIRFHFEDDPVQAAIIRKHTDVTVILINSPTEKENVRHV